MKELLKLTDVYVSYGTRAVISGVSLEVNAGELCALLGLNGSGKSTLLKAICGLLPCRAAALRANGRPLGKMNEYERAKWLAYIPQRGSPATGLTVMDMVLMGFNPRLKLLESPTGAMRALAVRTLERVGLTGYADTLFDRISEGQRQLAVFARALVQDAPVMLLDEPDSALDFVNRHQVLGRIAQTVRQEGKAGLITLHDPNFAMAYCDRLLLLKNGALTADVAMDGAKPEELGALLSRLYGPVQVFEHGGRLLMLKV